MASRACHVALDLGTLGTGVAKCQATRMHDVSGRRLGMEDTWLDLCHVSIDTSCLMFEWRNMGRGEAKGKEFFLEESVLEESKR